MGQHAKISGVYKITNIISGKFYIGSSIDVINRFSQHKSRLKKQKHHSPYLQNAWNKYGKEAFIFEILEECVPIREIILEIEQRYINFLLPQYNISQNATSLLGLKKSDEAKKRISAGKKGRSNGHEGSIHSDETKKKNE